MDKALMQQRARLIRFVDNPLPGGVACEFDQLKNLLIIDRVIFDSVDDKTKELLWRAQGTLKVDTPALKKR